LRARITDRYRPPGGKTGHLNLFFRPADGIAQSTVISVVRR
jgi:hypothetical protein